LVSVKTKNTKNDVATSVVGLAEYKTECTRQHVNNRLDIHGATDGVYVKKYISH